MDWGCKHSVSPLSAKAAPCWWVKPSCRACVMLGFLLEEPCPDRLTSHGPPAPSPGDWLCCGQGTLAGIRDGNVGAPPSLSLATHSFWLTAPAAKRA